jgi:predicted O-linked N-acetylglucosamine transferase (SPINDLY family)
VADQPVDRDFESAVSFHRVGKLRQAEELYLQVLRTQPNHQEALYRLGNVFQDTKRNREAAAVYRRLLDLNPNFADAQINFGTVQYLLGEYDQALAALRKGLALSPGQSMGWFRLADVHRVKWDMDETVAALREAVRIRPDFSDAWANLGTALRDMARLDEALACFDRALAIQPDKVTTDDNRVYSLYYHGQYDPPAIYREHLKWNRQHAEPLRNQIQEHRNDRDPERRLRIGYVSPDFRIHCQALFMVPVLARHDHKNFEIFCYSDVRIPDRMTANIQAFPDHWRSIVGMSDTEVAQLIRGDKIDILIDLTMHMAAARPLLFARKPAPIQVAWLAYPGTTGMSVMDYRLTDPRLDPPGSNDEFYSERSIRLPDTFWCYDPLSTEPPVNELPALDAGYVTFGCLNNFCKLNSPWLQVWGKVLAAVPTSRLVLLAPRGSVRQEVLRELKIDPGRVDFVELIPRGHYLKRYLGIDLALDTFPYNGHTTSLDALWMGVPVVSRFGTTAASRAGLSQSFHVGLTDLVAEDAVGFVRIAVQLANDLPRLAELRRTLRGRMQQSPLMDAVRFTMNLEAAYRQMWRQWCKSA